MRKVSQEELAKILEKHKKWLDGDPDGERADLSWANLSDANLSRANLWWANLSTANLSWANLSRAEIDYSSLPLWCGSLDAQFVDLANGFHRASECGKIIITNEEVS